MEPGLQRRIQCKSAFGSCAAHSLVAPLFCSASGHHVDGAADDSSCGSLVSTHSKKMQCLHAATRQVLREVNRSYRVSRGPRQFELRSVGELQRALRHERFTVNGERSAGKSEKGDGVASVEIDRTCAEGRLVRLFAVDAGGVARFVICPDSECVTIRGERDRSRKRICALTRTHAANAFRRKRQAFDCWRPEHESNV